MAIVSLVKMFVTRCIVLILMTPSVTVEAAQLIQDDRSNMHDDKSTQDDKSNQDNMKSVLDEKGLLKKRHKTRRDTVDSNATTMSADSNATRIVSLGSFSSSSASSLGSDDFDDNNYSRRNTVEINNSTWNSSHRLSNSSNTGLSTQNSGSSKYVSSSKNPVNVILDPELLAKADESKNYHLKPSFGAKPSSFSVDRALLTPKILQGDQIPRERPRIPKPLAVSWRSFSTPNLMRAPGEIVIPGEMAMQGSHLKKNTSSSDLKNTGSTSAPSTVTSSVVPGPTKPQKPQLNPHVRVVTESMASFIADEIPRVVKLVQSLQKQISFSEMAWSYEDAVKLPASHDSVLLDAQTEEVLNSLELIEDRLELMEDIVEAVGTESASSDNLNAMGKAVVGSCDSTNSGTSRSPSPIEGADPHSDYGGGTAKSQVMTPHDDSIVAVTRQMARIRRSADKHLIRKQLTASHSAQHSILNRDRTYGIADIQLASSGTSNEESSSDKKNESTSQSITMHGGLQKCMTSCSEFCVRLSRINQRLMQEEDKTENGGMKIQGWRYHQKPPLFTFQRLLQNVSMPEPNLEIVRDSKEGREEARKALGVGGFKTSVNSAVSSYDSPGHLPANRISYSSGTFGVPPHGDRNRVSSTQADAAFSEEDGFFPVDGSGGTRGLFPVNFSKQTCSNKAFEIFGKIDNNAMEAATGMSQSSGVGNQSDAAASATKSNADATTTKSANAAPSMTSVAEMNRYARNHPPAENSISKGSNNTATDIRNTKGAFFFPVSPPPDSKGIVFAPEDSDPNSAGKSGHSVSRASQQVKMVEVLILALSEMSGLLITTKEMMQGGKKLNGGRGHNENFSMEDLGRLWSDCQQTYELAETKLPKFNYYRNEEELAREKELLTQAEVFRKLVNGQKFKNIGLAGSVAKAFKANRLPLVSRRPGSPAHGNHGNSRPNSRPVSPVPSGSRPVSPTPVTPSGSSRPQSGNKNPASGSSRPQSGNRNKAMMVGKLVGKLKDFGKSDERKSDEPPENASMPSLASPSLVSPSLESSPRSGVTSAASFPSFRIGKALTVEINEDDSKDSQSPQIPAWDIGKKIYKSPQNNAHHKHNGVHIPEPSPPLYSSLRRRRTERCDRWNTSWSPWQSTAWSSPACTREISTTRLSMPTGSSSNALIGSSSSGALIGSPKARSPNLNSRSSPNLNSRSGPNLNARSSPNLNSRSPSRLSGTCTSSLKSPLKIVGAAGTQSAGTQSAGTQSRSPTQSGTQSRSLQSAESGLDSKRRESSPEPRLRRTLSPARPLSYPNPGLSPGLESATQKAYRISVAGSSTKPLTPYQEEKLNRFKEWTQSPPLLESLRINDAKRFV